MPSQPRRIAIASAAALGLLLLAGCSAILGLDGEYVTADVGADATPGVDSGPRADVPAAEDAPHDGSPDVPGQDSAPAPLAFQPSNLTADSIMAQAAMAVDEDVEGTGCQIQTVASNLGGCLMSPIVTTTEPFGAGQTQTIALVVVRSLKLGASSSMMIEGNLPLVIVSLGDVTLNSNAAIQANSSSALAYVGPGGAPEQGNGNAKGNGPGGGPAGNTMTPIGAGGGSFCGQGGPGGGTTVQTPAYGSADVRPLQGGSSGGGATGDPGGSGAGGGAIQIVAAGSITVNTGAYITVSGQGAQSCIGGACSGGGSGGAILLEGASVTIAGILAANGGGGGSGQTAGSDGLPLSAGTAPTAAQGGAAAPGSAAAGGKGSAGASLVGGSGGAGSSTVIPGGGGGGAGWIRINSASGAATLTGGTLSPGTTTPCATQGKLRTIGTGA